jgi:hypothetical protein
MAHVNAMAVSLPLLKVVQNGIKANSGFTCLTVDNLFFTKVVYWKQIIDVVTIHLMWHISLKEYYVSGNLKILKVSPTISFSINLPTSIYAFISVDDITYQNVAKVYTKI